MLKCCFYIFTMLTWLSKGDPSTGPQNNSWYNQNDAIHSRYIVFPQGEPQAEAGLALTGWPIPRPGGFLVLQRKELFIYFFNYVFCIYMNLFSIVFFFHYHLVPLVLYLLQQYGEQYAKRNKPVRKTNTI